MNTLLHICCAPCAIEVVKSLRCEDIEVTGFWFNPNIHPYGEWKLRRDALVKLAGAKELPVIYDDKFDLKSNLNMLLENPEFGVRCLKCYEDRIRATAKTAKANDFKTFTTTLLYSKYQLHDEIRRIASEIAEKVGVAFLYRDFRPLWGRGIASSKKMGLYRQRWCGCIFSEFEVEKQREERFKNSR